VAFSVFSGILRGVWGWYNTDFGVFLGFLVVCNRGGQVFRVVCGGILGGFCGFFGGFCGF